MLIGMINQALQIQDPSEIRKHYSSILSVFNIFKFNSTQTFHHFHLNINVFRPL